MDSLGNKDGEQVMEVNQNQMATSTGAGGLPEAGFRIPQDICEWVAPEDLVAWVREETAAMVAPDLAVVQALAAQYDPRLAVLSFAYVRGIYDHDEIEEATHSDPGFRALLTGGAVSASDLTSFRHRDRRQLVKLTRQLLIRATRQKFGLGDKTLPPDLQFRLQGEASDRLDNARNINHGEE